MQSDNQRAAEIQWCIVTSQAVTLEQIRFCVVHAIGDHKGSMLHMLDADDMARLCECIFKNARSGVLYNIWHSVFDANKAVDETTAKAFVLDFHNQIQEGINEFYATQIFAGTTIKKCQTAGDINTQRINSKQVWRLHLTTQGCGQYHCVREQLSTQQGDLLLMGPGALTNYHRQESCAEWQHHWVYFLQDEQLLKLLNWPEVGPNTYHLSLPLELHGKVETLFEQIIAISGDKAELSQRLAKNLLEQILIRVQKIVPAEKIKPIDPRIQQVKNYIFENFHEDFTVDDLAKDIGLSSPRLSSLFKQHTKTTIMKCRDEQRMIKAAQLLLQDQCAVSQVATAVGYSDALYFSRCFAQHFSCSPTEYRQRCV